MNKRKLLKSATAGSLLKVWVPPTVIAVLLPAHAMTSMCTENRVLGAWKLTILGYPYPVRPYVITLLEGGKTDGRVLHEWKILEDGTFRGTEDLTDWIFTSTFNSSCNYLSGTYVNNPGPDPGEPYPDPIIGDWYAQKL